MNLAMFSTKESYVEWLIREVEAIRNNGLRMAIDEYEKAIRGEGKDKWMKLNNTTNEEMWNKHLYWLEGNIRYFKCKIKKYQREIAKNSVDVKTISLDGAV